MCCEKGLPRGVSADRKVLEIIKDGALEAPFAERKTAGLNQVDLHPKTGGEPQQGGGVLWYVRFEQGEAQITPNRGLRCGQHIIKPNVKYSRCCVILRQSVA